MSAPASVIAKKTSLNSVGAPEKMITIGGCVVEARGRMRRTLMGSVMIIITLIHLAEAVAVLDEMSTKGHRVGESDVAATAE